jgi:hypothetical protein
MLVVFYAYLRSVVTPSLEFVIYWCYFPKYTSHRGGVNPLRDLPGADASRSSEAAHMLEL